MVKIEHTPEFIFSMWRLGYVSQEEFDKFMLSEDKYIPKFNMEENKKVEQKRPMYVMIESGYSNEVRDFIETVGDMEHRNGVTVYRVNNCKFVVFDG